MNECVCVHVGARARARVCGCVCVCVCATVCLYIYLLLLFASLGYIFLVEEYYAYSYVCCTVCKCGFHSLFERHSEFNSGERVTLYNFVLFY